MQSFFSKSLTRYLPRKRLALTDVEKGVPIYYVPGSWEREYAPPPPPPCYIVKLPNDILVDQIFGYLEVLDIIHLRQVCKLFYSLTHHAALWKRLLRWADVPLPPLPPVYRHSLTYMNGLEAERLLLRATSIERAWGIRDHPCAFNWRFDAHHTVLSMVILPGGRYLVASVAGRGNDKYCIVVYMLDHVTHGAVTLAKTATTTKAFHLTARYMTLENQHSIVIAYVRRDYRNRAYRKKGYAPGNIDISEYSLEHEIDPAVGIKYECVVMQIPLVQLETLGHPRLKPGTREFLRYAQSQPPPFQLLARIRSRQQLMCPCLDELHGDAYLAIVKQPSVIMFKKLEGGSVATLRCPPYPGYEVYKHTILAIRLIPFTSTVLVFRKVHQPAAEVNFGRPKWYFTAVEQYNALESGNVAKEVVRGPHEQTCLDRSHDIISIELTDHGLRTFDDNEDSVLHMTNSAAQNMVPSPIAGCARVANESLLYRFSIFPKRHGIEVPLPPTPPSGPPPILPEFCLYMYSVRRGIHRYVMWQQDATQRYRCLLGSRRSIVYTISADDTSDLPRVLRISRYYDPESYDEETLNHAPTLETEDDPGIRPVWLPENVDLDQVSALAWDESIGRLMLAFRNSTHICVIDYSQSPKHDENGQRLPLPVELDPNPDEYYNFLPQTWLTPEDNEPGDVMDV